MVYEYKCFNCGEEQDVVKPHTEINAREFCIHCNSLMKRVEVNRHVFMKPDKFQAHYSPAFGKIINSKRDLKNEVSRHNAEHGTDLQEVGNETYKPKRRSREYDYREAAHELKKLRGY